MNHPVLFRSKEPRRVPQEAYGFVIGYNVVRALMLKAAIKHAVDPLRLSFVDTLDRIRGAAPVMAAAPTADLPWLYARFLASVADSLIPVRDRTNPREVCTKMSNYAKKWKSVCA